MIAIYARQSVEKKDSISIEAQIDFCRKLLAQDEAYQVYADSGYSGKNTSRPRFQQMMEDVRAGKITKILVYKLDRISRAIVDFSSMLEILNAHQVEFVSVTQPIDTTNPMGKAMLSVVMVFAQLERETIQQRVRDNYYERGSRGFYLGGKPPFGFDKIPTHMNGKKTARLFENMHGDLVRRIYSAYALPGATLGEVVKQLAKEEAPTPVGKPWNTATLGRLLRNPAYVRADAEVYRFLREKGALIHTPAEEFSGARGCYLFGQRAALSDAQSLAGCFVTLAAHEGLVSPGIWMECQRKLERNRPLKNGGKGTHSWLSGRMRCGYCGYALTVAQGRHGVYYISCGGRKLKICTARKRVIYLQELEDCVEAVLTWRLSVLETVRVPEKEEAPGELNRLKLALWDNEERIRNLLNQIQEGGEISARYLEQSMAELDTRRKELQTQTAAFAQESPQDGKRLPADFSKAWKELPFEVKKRLAAVLIRQVTVTDDTVTVELF